MSLMQDYPHRLNLDSSPLHMYQSLLAESFQDHLFLPEKIQIYIYIYIAHSFNSTNIGNVQSGFLYALPMPGV